MLDATDSMTSQTVQARHAYQAADISLVADAGHVIIRRLPDGVLTVDYSCFQSRADGADTLQAALANLSDAEPPRAPLAETPFSDIAGAAAASEGASEGTQHSSPQACTMPGPAARVARQRSGVVSSPAADLDDTGVPPTPPRWFPCDSMQRPALHCGTSCQ